MSGPIAVIGRAWRTPLGATIEGAIARLLAGERAAVVNRDRGYACSLAAPILDAPARSRHGRFLRRMGLYGMEVAREALDSSGLGSELGRIGRTRIGLFSGVGGLRAHWDDMMPALAAQTDDGRDAWARGLRDVHPYWMLKHLSNNVHALASAELDLRGEGATFGGATGSAQAMAAAIRALRDGAIDAALVVAYDSLLEPETLVELGARRAATHAISPPPPAYDREALGFVPGEAAAAIVVVRADARVTQNVQLEALATGDGERAEPTPATIGRLVRRLAGDARPGLVDGAARAWPELDTAETDVLAEIVPDARLGAITAAMGQLGAATSLVQVIALAELLARKTFAPVAGLAAPSTSRLVTAVTPTDACVALGLSTGAPGLAAAVRIEVTR
jgi:3-oxoacyl-(acyl-carrier-protein) synthase